MRSVSIVSVLAVIAVGLFARPADAQPRSVAFDGGIGVVSWRGNTSPPLLNVVHGINPAGQLWTIEDLKADVRVDGSIRVTGTGLLFAGGDNIGTRGTVASIGVRLVCDGVAHTTANPIPLDEAGDFRFDGSLTTVPANPCVAPVLLITNATGTSWFAAGILKVK
jgi:hypothetical protein